jgi:hypothetical protein
VFIAWFAAQALQHIPDVWWWWVVIKLTILLDVQESPTERGSSRAVAAYTEGFATSTR